MLLRDLDRVIERVPSVGLAAVRVGADQLELAMPDGSEVDA